MGRKKPIIALTRPEDRSKAAIEIVESLGGDYFLAPTLELSITKSDSLIKLYENVSRLDWLIFTSPETIKSIMTFFPGFKVNGKIAVIGSKTEEYAIENGFKVDLVPENYTAEGLIESFKNYDLNGKVIGIPRTLKARKILPDTLMDMGAEVIVAEAYKSEVPKDKSKIKELIDLIMNSKIDAITFTSPLTFLNLMELVEDKEIFIEKLSKDILTVAIGPVTGNVIKKEGIKCFEPDRYTVRDMLEFTFDLLEKQ